GLRASFCAPYSSLYEQLTLSEAIAYHTKFRSFIDGLDPQSLINLAYLEGEENKQIQHFSSGMKQRLKLALCICTQSDLLILDEPCSNLDKQAIEWYRKVLGSHQNGRTLIIATNDIENDVIKHDSIVNLSLNK
ncbi:MAG: ABC transporter ATP-binding protein, partial [Flavobacteriales bacterium]